MSIKKKFAYATTVFRGDGYIPGALTMAHSLRMSGIDISKIDIIITVTPDISAKAIQALKLVYDHVFVKEYITFKTGPLETQKQVKIYDWSSDAFTKWHILAYDQYKKIIFLDSDLVICQNLDHVFKESAPLGTFTLLWIEQGDNNPSKYHKKAKYKNYYKSIKEFGQVPPNVIKNALTDGFVSSGHLVMIEPDKKEFKEFMEMVKSMEPFKMGHSISMMDEQSLAHYQSGVKGRSWTKLTHSYNFVMWHVDKIHRILRSNKLILPKVIHFMFDNPWETPRYKWPDSDMWFQVAADFYTSHGKPKLLNKFFKVSELNMPPQKKCPFCISIEDKLPVSSRGKTDNVHPFVINSRIVCLRFFDTLSHTYQNKEKIGGASKLKKFVIEEDNKGKGKFAYDDKYTFSSLPDDSFNFWLKKGYFSEKSALIAVNSYVSKNGVIVDVGAHIGTMSVPFAKMVPNGRVISFEPQKKMYQILVKNLKDNRIMNCETFNLAVGHKHGITVEMNDKPFNLLGDLTAKSLDGKNIDYSGWALGSKGEEVSMVTISEHLNCRVDLIKVDVEGFEACVLYGSKKYIKKYKPMILFEYTPKIRRILPAIKKSSQITKEIEKFDVMKYCASVGYDRVIKIKHNYLILCPNHQIKRKDPKFKIFKNGKINKMDLYIMADSY
jgi:FkbM family methyltransferase